MSKMLFKMNLISVVQQLPKEDIETIQGYVEMIEKENEELKKQLENKYEKVGTLTNEILYEENTKLINQQKDFIKYLEDEISKQKNDIFINALTSEDIDLYMMKIKLQKLEKILQKYKEIIGDDK